MSWAIQRRESSITHAILAGSILLPLFSPFSTPFFQLSEFAPPQVVYARDLVPMLFAPWASPSSAYRVLSRLLQSTLLFCSPKDAMLRCYRLWIAIALSRVLLGFLLSRSVGWAYPYLFSHWALYESSGGCGPSLVAYFLISGVRLNLGVLAAHIKRCKWEVTESLVLLATCMLLAGLDHAPWTYGIAIGLAIFVITFRFAFTTHHPLETTVYSHPNPDSHQGSTTRKRFCTDIRIACLLSVLVSLPGILSAFLTSSPTVQMPSPSGDGAPLLEILLLSYPRPNDTPSSPGEPSILSQTIASYLPYVSSSTALSVFTHARVLTHPSFTDAQRRFKDTPITFHADQDMHPDAYESQHLHLAEAFRWVAERDAASPEWIMLVEDDFPICGERGWQGVVGVMQTLHRHRGHAAPSPESTKVWGGFVGTGGSGLILHRTLLPILANVLRMHALTSSPFPPFAARRPADIIVQDCLLGVDPLCPAAPSSKDRAEGTWFSRTRPAMVITSRLVMDHIGGHASTIAGRAYDSSKWRCGWRHPFHGRPEVIVVPI